MSKDFLTRLWWVCSAEDGLCKEGLNLCELYERTEEGKQAQQAFADVLDTFGLTPAQRTEVDNADNRQLDAAELQGFLNGWRLCAMLQGEVAGKGGGKA